MTLKAPEITEFLADNRKGLAYDDGDASDWIELRNPNAYRLNLDGYHLTDDPAQPADADEHHQRPRLCPAAPGRLDRSPQHQSFHA
jgi:hypothetical protein